jgi:glycosyltransferase involved in cell wall biosynthesis
MLLDKAFPPDARVEREILALREAGYAVELVHEQPAEGFSESSWNGIPLHGFPSTRRRSQRWWGYAGALTTGRNLFWDSWLPSRLGSGAFEVVHCHDLPIAMTGIRLARRLGAKVVFDRHENWPGMMEGFGHTAPPGLKTSLLWATVNNPSIWRHWERQVLRRSDLVITVSPEAEGELPVRPRRVAVVSNYVGLESMPDPSPWPAPPPPLRVCFLGTLNDMFSLVETVEAIALLPQGAAELVLIGDGDARRRLLEMAAAEGLEGAVRVTGWLPRQEALALVSSAHACVLPLRDNALTRTTVGNKMFEYMGLERAVLSSGVGVMARIVRETGGGLIVDPWTPQAVANALRPFLVDSTPLLEMGRRGRRAVLDRYNWNVEKVRLVEAYASLGSGGVRS